MSKRAARMIAWMIVAVFVAGVGSAFTMSMLAHQVQAQTWELAAAFSIYPIVGAAIIAQRPRNTIGLLLLAIGFGTTITYFSAGYLAYGPLVVGRSLPGAPFLDWLSNCVWPLNMGLGAFLILLFPTGRPPTPRWRWVIWLGVITLIMMITATAFMPGPFSGETTTNPLGVEALRGPLEALNQVAGPFALLLFVTVALSALVRFWRSRGEERQQMKWFASGIVLMVVAISANMLWFPSDSLGYAIGFAVPPLGVGIAVLRYRLYDIDILINRALVYGSLTAALAAIYFAVVIGSQSLTTVVIGAPTGQTQQPVVIVLSTLLIAALFQPLRRRFQRAIDRRFYRRKYDAARTLAAFGQTLRTEVNMEGLCEHLITAVEDTMQPTHISLWLRQPSDRAAR